MKYIFYACVLAVIFVLVEVVAVSVATLSMPNSIEFELLNNFNMFVMLIKANPVSAFELFILSQPILIIQNISETAGTQIWGVYIMPVSIILWLVMSVFFVYLKITPVSGNTCWLMLVGSALLMIATFYLRVQACCTEKPSWLVDVIILSRVFNPLQNSTVWQDIYLSVSPWFQIMQLTTLITGAVVLYLAYLLVNRNNIK